MVRLNQKEEGPPIIAFSTGRERKIQKGSKIDLFLGLDFVLRKKHSLNFASF